VFLIRLLPRGKYELSAWPERHCIWEGVGITMLTRKARIVIPIAGTDEPDAENYFFGVEILVCQLYRQRAFYMEHQKHCG